MMILFLVDSKSPKEQIEHVFLSLFLGWYLPRSLLALFFLRSDAPQTELQALLAEEQRRNEELRAEMRRCEQSTAQVFAKDAIPATPAIPARCCPTIDKLVFKLQL